MNDQVKIVYRNWKGVTSTRTILPEGIWLGSTQWHPEEQWFLKAYDLDKGELRDFAMADILSWGKIEE